MNQPSSGDKINLPEQLDCLRANVKSLASQQEGNTRALLSILRTLEMLHREIRVDMFEPILPNTRKDLYSLLKDIEESGGWPYIERMKLQALLLPLLKWEENKAENFEK
ncbi:MAG: hypothetical protein N5P05_000789 [Chroococcopsis gigantea SAG 12.99]|jgi:hypothetical protein|nr:hypothetical protein [Chlorogloea purpurea SAG 13.99]MDV2999183.1 hypothetical protein [Chroococcopsis gigantea SAG 12.99]